jgi:hypothetical protein
MRKGGKKLNKLRRIPRLSFALLLAVLHVSPAHGQDVNATITGVVRDATGSVVPNATVRATNTGTDAQFQTITGSDGSYALRSIPVGSYNLQVEATGFKRFEAKGIRLQVNEVARYDAALDVGGTTETVTVTADVTAVDTTTSSLRTVIDQKRIEEMPLNGRNPTQLMRLVAGVVTDFRADVTSGTTYPGVTPVSVNGNRANATNYVLDGAQNNDHYTNAPNPMPNPDALQEFSVQVNNFSAEFGRQSGGLVNAVTKSGTNQLHGSVFEFVRNHALNAANFFAPTVNGVRQDDGLKRHQFGGTLGGPIWIPKLYNGRSRSFFFFSYQGTLQRRVPNATNVIVPTEAQRNGDFSSLGRPLRDPIRGGEYPNNRIPASDISPIARGVLQYVPLPTSGNRLFYSARNNDDDHQILVRLDHELTSNNRLSGRFWNSAAETPAFLDPTNYLAVTVGRTWLNRSAQLTDTHVFGPSLTNQVMFAFNRTDGNNVPIYPEKSVASLGANYFNDDKPQYHITVAGYWGQLNTGDTNQFLRDEYQFIDTVRWTKGRHQMTFGFDYGRGIGDVTNNFRANGQWQFNGPSAPFTGDSFADFLVGKFFTLNQGIGEYKMTRFTRTSVFAHDSFKVHHRLTLDLGVRWEPFMPFHDVDGKMAVWYPGQQSTRYVNAPRGVLYPGDAGVPKGGAGTTWSNFGPRTGFAWDVFGDGRTSVRGGYGVFFDQPNTLYTNNLANQAPFGTVVTINGNAQNSWGNPWAGTTNPFPASTTPPSNVTFPQFSSQTVYAPDWRNPYVQAWNVTIEREIAGGFVSRSSYAGSKGTNLGVMRELNPAVFAPGATTATTNQRRLYAPALGSTAILEPSGNSSFHALQLTAERRFNQGFSILANYQFSKAIDDSSHAKESGISRTNPYDQSFDKAPADFDRTHVFNFSGLWELPIRFENRLANTLLGGWTINGIVSAFSGFPFTVASGVDNARTGAGGQRADLVGDPYFPSGQTKGEKIQEWLRKSAFQSNAIGTYGVLGRNVFRGPGYSSVDTGLFKRFAITEQLSTTLRFEVFNTVNRTNLSGPNTSLTSGDFMRTTAALPPRILQLAARITW